MSWGGDNTKNITFHIVYRFQTRCSESENLKIKGEYLELLNLSARGSLQETTYSEKHTEEDDEDVGLLFIPLLRCLNLFARVVCAGACRCVRLLVVMNVLFTCCFTQQEVELCWLHAEHLNASLRLMLSITADQCSTYWLAHYWSSGINTLCVNVCVCDLSHLV